MSTSRVKVSLRIWHPTMASAAISTALGIEAKFASTVGERRETPAGNQLGGNNYRTYWSARLENDSTTSLDDTLCSVLPKLESKREFLREVVSSGGEIELYVGWFLMQNDGASLSPELLARLGALKIRLSVDVLL